MHKIFLMEDNLQCNVCHRHGHSESQCHRTKTRINTETTQTTQQETHSQQQIAEPEIETIELTSNSSITHVDEIGKDNNRQEEATPQHQRTKTPTFFPVFEKPKTTEESETLAEIPRSQETEQRNEIPEYMTRILTQINEETTNKTTLTQEETDRIRQYLNRVDNLITSTSIKRPALNTNIDEEITQIEEPDTKTNPKAKKPKSSIITPTELEKLLVDVKTEIQTNPDKYILEFDTFKDFIFNSQEHRDKISLAKDYTTEIPRLISMLQELYHLLQDSRIKNRFTRLINKLNPNDTSSNENTIMEP